MSAVNYPVLDIFLTTMWFFLWVLWIFLLVRVFMDLFRDRDMSGWWKAGWSVFLIVLPFLGVLVYLIARGKGMAERQAQEAAATEAQFRAYVRDTAQETPSAKTSESPETSEQLARLVELKNHGDLTEEEYRQAKSKVLAA
ncbi:SHOCT domain-containing protein [Streptacidiphilus sp. MAP5-3]|uniref:SHOCT domain-containing protein n=1 Tax=unclassified Streptacidiphilus TaxID=2643834 RepID=UPI0035132266